MCTEALLAHKGVTREAESTEHQLLLAVAAGCIGIMASFSDEKIKETSDVEIRRQQIKLVSLWFANIVLAKRTRDGRLIWPTSSNVFETLTAERVKTRCNFGISHDV